MDQTRSSVDDDHEWPLAEFIPPLDLSAHLDEFVVGQSRAKIQLSVLFSMHLAWFEKQNPIHRAPNGLVFGPTGVGKTFTIERACARLQLPFVSVDASALVPSGIVGMQVEDVLSDLCDAARTLTRPDDSQAERLPTSNFAPKRDREGGPDSDDLTSSLANLRRREGERKAKGQDATTQAIRLAQRGVVFLDEFDKLAKSSDSTLNERAQRRLLRLTDGGHLSIGSRESRSVYTGRTMDTTGVLFIAGGAFEGIRESRIRSARPPAISRSLPNPSDVISADIASFGFLPEVVGRFPTLIEFDSLEVDQYEEILGHNEVSPITIWRLYTERLGLTLDVDPEVPRLIAERAKSVGLGARGLQQILFPMLSRSLFNALSDGSKIVRLSADDFLRRPTRGTKDAK